MLKNFLNIFGIDIYHYDFRNSVQNYLTDLITTNKIKEVWDVGANKGQYATMLRNIGYSERIMSFEAMPKEFKILKGKAANDSKWVAIGPIAIGSNEGATDFFITSDSVSSSILKPLRSKAKNKIVVEVRRLDHYSKELKENVTRMLKLDVQGSEYDCISSAGNSINKFSFIQMETSISPLYKGEKNYIEMIELMREKMFKPIFFYPGVYNEAKEIIQLEIFFSKD